jgi:chromosome segregation ATPase
METALRRREQEVWQACDDLWALCGDSKQLTGDAIRERLVLLGKSRGSPNEIYKYRKSWSESRRIDAYNHQHLDTNNQDLDPISRAVKLVHEKLLSETDQKIQELVAQHDAEILSKNQELENKNADLTSIINQLGQANLEIEKTQREIKNLTEYLNAETEIRKAQEREVAHAKANHALIMQELSTAHQNMCESLQKNYTYLAQEQKEYIKILEQEKKLLGAEFSEKLTEIKIINYNLELQIKNLRDNLEIGEKELQEKSLIITSYDNKYKFIQQEQKNFETQLHALTTVQKLLKEELRVVRISNKQQDITIAKLRATLHARENYEPRSRATSRSITLPTATYKHTCPQQPVQNQGS